jgi:hypothetical protein
VKKFGFAVSLIIMLGISGCIEKPLAPVMPTWDVQLTMPLVNRTYTIAQVVEKDTSLLRAGAGNQVLIAAHADVKPVYVGDNLSFMPRSATARMRVGIFNVTMAPIVTPVTIPGLPPGLMIPVRDTTIAVPSIQDTITAFESATLVDGIMSLSLRNNLPVPVDVTGPFYMIDDASNVIAVFEYYPSTIPANSTRTAQDNLGTKTIGSTQVAGNVVTITGLTLHIHGSTTPVQIPYGDMLVGTITTTGLRASRAVNVLLPSQRLVNSDSSNLPLTDSTLIQEIRIRSGGLALTMRNGLGLAMYFRYRFSELFRWNGSSYVAYEDSVYLASGASSSQNVNVAGCMIRSAGGSLLSSLQAVSTVVIPIPSNQAITVSDTDNVRLTVNPTSSIVIDSVSGVVRPTAIAVRSVVPLGLKKISSKLQANIALQSASLVIGTESSVGFPLDAFLRVTGKKANADSISMDVPAAQRRVLPGEGAIAFDESEVGRFVSQFSGHLPDSLLVSGHALVNPADVYNPTLAGVGHVGSHSNLAGEMQLQIPLTLGMSNGTFADTLVLGDTSGSGHRDFIPDKEKLKNVNAGHLYLEVLNSTGMQVDVGIRLMDSLKHVLFTLPRPGQTIRVNAATLDASGLVVSPTRSTIVIDLTGDEVRQFAPANFATYSISFVTAPGNSTVKILTTDGVGLRVWSDLSYRVSK